jgi:hypothetical protein
MRPTKVFLALLIMVSLLSAFNADRYLYTGEEITDEEVFAITTTVYKLIFIDGNATLLLKNDEPMTDASKIESVLVQHYTSLYYPHKQ